MIIEPHKVNADVTVDADVCIIGLMGTCFGLLHSPRRTLKAWKAAKSEIPLQPVNMDNYGSLMQLSVAELRSKYGVGNDGITGARKLHEKAPGPGMTT